MWQYTQTGMRLHYFAGTSKNGKNRIAQCGLIKPIEQLHSPTRDGLEHCAKCEAELYRPKWK